MSKMLLQTNRHIKMAIDEEMTRANLLTWKTDELKQAKKVIEEILKQREAI